MQFAQLLQLREIGVPIPDDQLLEACTLQNKKQLIDSITESKKQEAEMANKQAEIQMAEIQSRTQLAQARAYADMGLYAERTSRVDENRAMAIQKLHEANKQDEQATLEKVKLLKELESIDIDHLHKLIQVSTLLKNQEIAQAETLPGKENSIQNPQPEQSVSAGQ